MLSIKNLHVQVGGKLILNGVDLEINPGEIHAIMGPNGSGKSTLANVLAGRDNCKVIQGSVTYRGKSLLGMEPEIRAREGIFLAFQYPIEIPGVTNLYLIKASINAIRKHRGEEELDTIQLLKRIKEKAETVNMTQEFLYRSVNADFSGGEKKRNEILQMILLKPYLSILDETDSGLDIDALQIVSQGINALKDETRSMIVVTHYQRLLNYIIPDRVHVLANGKIIRSGDKQLAFQLEERGYGWITNIKSQ